MVISFYPASAGFFIVKIYQILTDFLQKNPQKHRLKSKKLKNQYFSVQKALSNTMSQCHIFIQNEPTLMQTKKYFSMPKLFYEKKCNKQNIQQ